MVGNEDPSSVGRLGLRSAATEPACGKEKSSEPLVRSNAAKNKYSKDLKKNASKRCRSMARFENHSFRNRYWTSVAVSVAFTCVMLTYSS